MYSAYRTETRRVVVIKRSQRNHHQVDAAVVSPLGQKKQRQVIPAARQSVKARAKTGGLKRPQKKDLQKFVAFVCFSVCLSVCVSASWHLSHLLNILCVYRVMDKTASQVLPSKRSRCQKILQSKILSIVAYHLPYAFTCAPTERQRPPALVYYQKRHWLIYTLRWV